MSDANEEELKVINEEELKVIGNPATEVIGNPATAEPSPDTDAEIEAATNPTAAEQEAKPISEMSPDELGKYAHIQRWRKALKKTHKNQPSIFDFPTVDVTPEYLENKARQLKEEYGTVEKLHQELFADPWNYKGQVVYVYPNKKLWEDRPQQIEIDDILYDHFKAAEEKYKEAANEKKADDMKWMSISHSGMGRRMGNFERYLGPPGAQKDHPDDETIDKAYPWATPCHRFNCAIQGGSKKSKSKYSRKLKSKSKKSKSKKSKSKKSKSKKSKYSRKY